MKDCKQVPLRGSLFLKQSSRCKWLSGYQELIGESSGRAKATTLMFRPDLNGALGTQSLFGIILCERPRYNNHFSKYLKSRLINMHREEFKALRVNNLVPNAHEVFGDHVTRHLCVAPVAHCTGRAGKAGE